MCSLSECSWGPHTQNINSQVFCRPRLYVLLAVRAGPHPGISCSRPLEVFLPTGQECGELLQREALCKVWFKQVPEFTGGHIRVDETSNQNPTPVSDQRGRRRGTCMVRLDGSTGFYRFILSCCLREPQRNIDSPASLDEWRPVKEVKGSKCASVRVLQRGTALKDELIKDAVQRRPIGLI